MKAVVMSRLNEGRSFYQQEIYGRDYRGRDRISPDVCFPLPLFPADSSMLGMVTCATIKLQGAITEQL